MVIQDGTQLPWLLVSTRCPKPVRKSLCVVGIFVIGSIIQTCATSINMLTLGRGIGGLGVGALSMLSPLYIAEVAAPEVRGSLMALEQFSIVSGVVVGFWIGF